MEGGSGGGGGERNSKNKMNNRANIFPYMRPRVTQTTKKNKLEQGRDKPIKKSDHKASVHMIDHYNYVYSCMYVCVCIGVWGYETEDKNNG